MQRDAAVVQDGDRVVGVAGVGGRGEGEVDEGHGVCEDVWACLASDPKKLGGQGV